VLPSRGRPRSKVTEGAVRIGTTYHQVRSVPSRSEERFEVTA